MTSRRIISGKQRLEHIPNNTNKGYQYTIALTIHIPAGGPG